eukprot:11437512-Alexandrium_andersonii.AAC.1
MRTTHTALVEVNDVPCRRADGPNHARTKVMHARPRTLFKLREAEAPPCLFLGGLRGTSPSSGSRLEH